MDLGHNNLFKKSKELAWSMGQGDSKSVEMDLQQCIYWSESSDRGKTLIFSYSVEILGVLEWVSAVYVYWSEGSDKGKTLILVY